MPGQKRGYTTPHRCATVDSSTRNQPSDRDRQARQMLQEKTSDFHVNFYDCVYLSIGLEAKMKFARPLILINPLMYTLTLHQQNALH